MSELAPVPQRSLLPDPPPLEGEKAQLSLCALEGDPWGERSWGEVLGVFPENPELGHIPGQRQGGPASTEENRGVDTGSL